MITQTIAIGKKQTVFVTKETNTSTTDLLTRMAKPTSYAENNYNFMLTSGEGAIAQELELLDDKQLRYGRSKKTPIAGRFNPGKFSFPTYIKTTPVNSGGKLMAGEQDVLLRSALGTGTTIDAPSTKTQLKYNMTNTANPSFTLWIKKDHTLFIGIGSTINTAKFDIKGSDVGSINWDGEFMQMLIAGTSSIPNGVVASALGTVSAVSVDATHGDMYDVGAVIEFVKADGTRVNNTGAGYAITAINADTLSISPELAEDLASGTQVTGYIPYSDGATKHEEILTSVPIHGKRGLMKIRPRTFAALEGGTVADIASSTSTIIVTEASITLNNNIKYSTDEKNDSFYAKDFFVSEFRNVEGTLTLYFRQNDAKRFKDALLQNKFELFVPCGDCTLTNVASSTNVTVANAGSGYEGKGFVLHLSHIQFKTPTIAGETEVMQTLAFSALATPTGMDDELEIYVV
jgi:hypothetical protein